MAWARKTADISRRHPTGFHAKWHPSNERRTPYCWHVTTEIWIVLLIGWKFTLSNHTHYPDLGSDLSSVWNFCALCSDVISRGNQSDGVAKCLLFSEAYYLIIPRGKRNFVKFPAQKQLGIRVRVQLENCEYLWKFSRYTFSFCYYIKMVTTLKPFFKRNWKQFSAGLRVYNTSSFLLYFRPSSFDCVAIDADCLYSRWWNTWICSWRLVSKQGTFFERHKLETFGHSKQALLAIIAFDFRMAWRIMQIAIEKVFISRG